MLFLCIKALYLFRKLNYVLYLDWYTSFSPISFVTKLIFDILRVVFVTRCIARIGVSFVFLFK